jgi:predicted Rossmann fold flavoprotein
MRFDVIVIGGGAAGLFCAIEAGKRGRRTLVIEHNAQVGRKILISGGGRCNFTNIHSSPEHFLSSNPHFSKSALSRFGPQDFIELVKSHQIDFYEKKLGQLFCRERSESIVAMLLDECRKARVKIRTNCSISLVQKNERFEVETTNGRFECDSLVVASGGLSFPKIGASNFGYLVARQFGLKIEQTRASLVAMVAKERTQFPSAAGVSLEAVVTAGGRSFRENILFTHRGLSGPAILQASNYWDPNGTVSIDLLPEIDAVDLLLNGNQSRRTLGNFLSQHLPEKALGLLLSETESRKRLNEAGNKLLQTIGGRLNRWQIQFIDTEGWDKAEVTLGGVSTDELSSKTMGTKKVPGLFFIGEVVDVTGWLGGYNFQWAWSSGFAAGHAV